MNIKEILLSDDVVSSITNNMDYLLNVIPELKFMIGFEQPLFRSDYPKNLSSDHFGKYR